MKNHNLDAASKVLRQEGNGMKKKIALVTSTLTVISMMGVGIWAIDNHYAKAADVEKNTQRILTNELNQAYRDARKQVAFLTELCAQHPENKKYKQQLKDAEDDLKILREQVKK
jgi:hypothetical protein